jgi:hypothetical protein
MDGDLSTLAPGTTGTSGGDAGSATGGGGPVSVPTTFSQAVAGTTPSFYDHVPAELKEASWVKDLAKNEKPFEALIRSYEGAQKLIGKNSGGLQVPGEGATEDEIKSFRKALGVPEAVDAYTFDKIDLSNEPEEVRAYLEADAKDDSFQKSMQEAALKAGLTPKQFKELAAVSDQWKLGYARDLIAAQDQRRHEQKQKFDAYYGDKAEFVQKTAKEIAQKVIPQEIHQLGDPEIALIEALRVIHEKVYKSDSIGMPATVGASTQSIREQITAIRNSEVYRNVFHPGHADAKRKVDTLYMAEVEADQKRQP